MKIKTPTYCLVAALAFSAPALHAAVITPLLSTASGSVTSSFFDSEDAARTIDSALDGSGLSATPTVANVLTVTHTSATATDNHYLGNVAITEARDNPANYDIVDEVLTFDLGSKFNITDIYLWTYERSQAARGLVSFDVAFSTDGGGTFSTAVAASTLGITDFALWGDGTGGTWNVQTPQQKTFSSAQSGVDVIQFSNIVNGGDTSRLGISEIRFGGTAVPEPSAALIGGLGALLLLRRRRN